MASARKSGGGNIILKLLILVLIVVLGYSVQFPKKQWARQAEDLELARARMNNLYDAGNIFRHFNKRFPNSFEEMLAALDTTVIEADPFSFTIEQKQDMDVVAELQDLMALEARSPAEDERLAVIQAGLRDSLLITLDDTMRIARFEVKDLGLVGYEYPDTEALAARAAAEAEAAKKRRRRNAPVEELEPVPTIPRQYYTTLVYAAMKPLYEGLGTDTLYLLSENPINVIKRYETPISRELWASTGGRFERRPDDAWFARGEVVSQPVSGFSFTLPMAGLNECPATGKPFVMKHVAKYKYKGAYLFTLDAAEGETLGTLARRQAFLNEVKGMASKEIGEIFSVLSDSATAAGNATFRVPAATQKKVIVEKTVAQLLKLKRRQQLLADAENTITAGIDSLEFYTDSTLREQTLFSEFQGQTAEHFAEMMKNPAVGELIDRVRVVPEFEEVKVDTVGLAIASPITGDEVYTSGWKRIFEVKPPENHGSIYNGTRSWEE